MDANAWAITNLTTAASKTMDQWQIDLRSVTRETVSAKIGTFRFTQIVSFDQDLDFNYDDAVQVLRQNVPVFYGRVTGIDRVGQGASERIDYTVSDPWWYLENDIFRQDWASRNLGVTTFSPRSRIILCGLISGAKTLTGDQIRFVFEYVIARGAPLQIGYICPGILIPFGEVRDQSCAEMVRIMLKYTPDVAIRINHSTTPPTIEAIDRPNQSVAAPFIVGAQPLKEFRARPRYDLQLPGVIIYFETPFTDDGVTYTQVVKQSAGIDTFRTVVMTVQLSGVSTVTQRQYIGLGPASALSAQWWASKGFAWLTNGSVTGPDGTGTPIITNGRMFPVQQIIVDRATELVDGQVPSWLKSHFTKVTASAEVSYARVNSDGAIIAVENQPITTNFIATDLSNSGTYTNTIQTSDGAEPIPGNCAFGIFQSVQTLHYEGQVTLEESDCACLYLPGTKVNVLGSRAEFATMDAVIQRVVEDIGSGRTELEIGPPNQLGPQDFVELARLQRNRMATFRVQERATGLTAVGGNVDGNTSGINDSGSAPIAPASHLTIAQAAATNPSKIILDPKDIVAAVRALSDKDIKFREFNICLDGVAKKVTLFGSDVYDA